MQPLPREIQIPVDEAAVDAAIAAGRERAANMSIMLVGLARDLGPGYLTTERIVTSLLTPFGESRAFIYENDSSDATASHLDTWSRRDPRITVMHEQLQRRKWPSVRSGMRGHDMAYYRNKCRDAFLASPAEALIVLDLDVRAVDSEGLLHTLASFDD